MPGRSLTTAASNALAASHVECALLVKLDFASGSVRFNSTDETITWGANTYIGAASCSGIEPIQESIAAVASAINLRFSGLNSAYLTSILNEQYQGLPANIWVALFNPATLALVVDPVLVFTGRMDEPLVTVGDTATIQLALENRLADWDRPRIRRYNHADQIARFSGDMFFEFVEELQSREVMWGIFKGPPAPDPLKVLNRTVDKALNTTLGKVLLAPFGVTKPTVNLARRVGDGLAKVFRW